MNTSSVKLNSWTLLKKNSLPPTSDTSLPILENLKKINTTPLTELSTGLIRELLPLLRTKDNVDLVGLSPSPETLKDIGISTRDLYPLFLNNNWLTVLVLPTEI